MYEVHITVAPADADATRSVLADLFIRSSEWRGTKLVEVVNHPGMPDAFTSQRLTGTYNGVRAHAEALVHELQRAGVSPLRCKVEADPFMLVDPRPVLYYETHLRVGGMTHLEDAGWSLVPNSEGLLLSGDPWGLMKNWVTLRSHELKYMGHAQRVHQAITSLLRCGVAVLRPPEVEAVVYDDNPGHDAAWERTGGGRF